MVNVGKPGRYTMHGCYGLWIYVPVTYMIVYCIKAAVAMLTFPVTVTTKNMTSTLFL